MKKRDIGRRPPPAAIHVAPRGARPDHRPPVEDRTFVDREPTMCERCGAVYLNRTWRAGERTRIARELEKAFGGHAHDTWSDREGGLDATWDPPPPPDAARAARPAPRRPRIKRRSLTAG